MIGWISAFGAVLIALCFFGLWQRETRDRHNLAQFIILMFLHPNVNESQRSNFLGLLKRIDAKDSGTLGFKAMQALTHHAGAVAGKYTSIGIAQMWMERTEVEYPKL